MLQPNHLGVQPRVGFGRVFEVPAHKQVVSGQGNISRTGILLVLLRQLSCNEVRQNHYISGRGFTLVANIGALTLQSQLDVTRLARLSSDSIGYFQLTATTAPNLELRFD